jgi:hypothetical protein
MANSAIVRVVNIEVDFPDRREACTRVDAALLRAKKDGVRVVKFIHGYGSTGVGGRLRLTVRSHLRRRKEQGEIACFVNGESLSSFDSFSKELVRHVPEIILDCDWGNANKGITLVLLKE